MKLTFSDQSTIEYWDDIYDQNDFTGYCYNQRMITVIKWLEGLSNSHKLKILDAGCGTGRFVREAINMGHSVFGIDHSYGMTAKAREHFNDDGKVNISFLQGDVAALPLPEANFDVIVCLGVISFLDSERNTLESLARVLKPGGILAISIVNKARLVYYLDIPILIKKLGDRIFQNIIQPWRNKNDGKGNLVVKPYFIPEFTQSLQRAGFSVIEYRTVPWKLLTFFNKEIFPYNMAVKITLFIERFARVPLVGSFGGMCIFKAKKDS